MICNTGISEEYEKTLFSKEKSVGIYRSLMQDRPNLKLV